MPNLYSFFFTHLSQQVDSTSGIINWVDPVNPITTLKPESREQNTIAFILPQGASAGTVECQVNNGFILLDTSSSTTTDGTWTADTTVQPVINWSAQLSTPITPSNLTVSYTVPISSGTTINLNLPDHITVPFVYGSYPNQTHTSFSIPRNYLFSQPAAFYFPSVQVGRDVFNFITADNGNITVDQSNIPGDLDNNLFTTDRISYYSAATASTTVLEDSVPNTSAGTEVFIAGVPEGNVIINWTIGGTIVSSAYIPAPDRGYLPSSSISTSMTGATLKEIALSLLALIQLNDVPTLLRVVKELVYIWSTVIGNINPDGSLNTTVVPGLPTDIPVCIPTLQSLALTRSTFEQSWLGFALVQSVKYLRSKPPAQLIEIPPYTELLIQQLAEVVANTVDSATGDCYQGYDQFGYLVDQPDLSAAVITQLFLQEYLSVSYSLYLHEASARLLIKLFSTIKVSPADAPTEHYAPLYKLFWKITQKIDFGTDALVTTIQEYLTTNSFSDFEQGLWVFLLLFKHRYGTDYINDYSTLVDDSFFHLQGPLYTRKQPPPGTQSKTPTLVASSWVVLFNHIQQGLIPELQFDLAALDALAFQSYLFAAAKRMMPYGYQWPSEEALSKNARLGALLYSIAAVSFTWYLAFSILRDGSSLATARGYVLDHWGASLLSPRPNLQPDRSYGNYLFNLLTTTRSTLNSLVAIADRYGLTIDIEEPHIYSYTYNGQSHTWTGSADDCSKVTVDTIVTAAADYYPYTSNSGQQVNALWQEVAPKVVVYCDQNCPAFVKEIVESTSAGVNLKVFYRQFTDDTLLLHTTTTVTS